jgi:hypothetical protein
MKLGFKQTLLVFIVKITCKQYAVQEESRRKVVVKFAYLIDFSSICTTYETLGQNMFSICSFLVRILGRMYCMFVCTQIVPF